ncbi:MAG: GNAT family N-acetyltransferase [Ktedonobacteraceae bacterium]|nr:GNAT family N-acetyltransferase [Ktedonobacteraceae bacterium]
MTKQLPHIALITKAQIPLAIEILEQAFLDDPLDVYTEPDPVMRKSIFHWFFTQAVHADASTHSIYTTPGRPEGVAVWVHPHAGEQTAQSDQEEMQQIFGPAAYERFVGTFSYFRRVHHEVMASPHWYLELLGVAPQYQGRRIGKALLIPVLQKADVEGLPCYLETFTAKNVPFYESSGFRVAQAGIEPRSQVPFWAMKREPGVDTRDIQKR